MNDLGSKNTYAEIYSKWITQNELHEDIVDVIENPKIFLNVKKKVLPHEYLIFLIRCFQKAKIIKGTTKSLIIPNVLSYKKIIKIENKVRKIFIEEYKKLNNV